MTKVTGGCQCGAVRYALSATPTGAALCHCRMCQKATGGPFLAAAGVPPAQFAWTRGAPATFRSSSLAERGFCATCGTPLTFRYLDQDRVSVTLGSLDAPDDVRPTEQIGVEARVAWWAAATGLPERTTEQDAPGLAARLADYQHPDHDTGDDWRPGGRLP
jgi:hypothetical protein